MAFDHKYVDTGPDPHPKRLFGIDRIDADRPDCPELSGRDPDANNCLGCPYDIADVPCPPNIRPAPPDILEGCEIDHPDPRYNGRIGLIPFAFHLVPLRALAKVAAVMRKGELHGRDDNGRDGWKEIPKDEHINHAIGHLLCHLGGRHSHHHLANAACRTLMALEIDTMDPNPDPLKGWRVEEPDLRRSWPEMDPQD